LTAILLQPNPTEPQPSILLGDYTEMRLGNKRFTFSYFKNAHVEGNMAIFLPAEKILMYVDVVFPQWSPFYGLGVSQDPLRFIGVMDSLLAFPFKYIIAGHLGRPATRRDTMLAKQYMLDMMTFNNEAYATFTNLTSYYTEFGQHKPPAANHWAVLHNWMGDMAFYCAGKMIQKYAHQIAGVDVYSWSGCWVLREAMGLYLPGHA